MNKTILITGSTDGIGLDTAKRMLKEGHRVLIHGRNPDKLQATLDALNAAGFRPQIDGFQADLSKLADIARLAREVADRHTQLDVLINNAGIFKTPETTASNGVDIRFMVNTIAPWVLTRLLLPLLAADGKIVNLSSAAQAPVNLDALTGQESIDDDFQAYAQSKLALTMWSMEPKALALNFDQSVVAVNPGSMLGSKMVKQGFGAEGKDLAIGVEILHKLALQPGALRNREYFDNDIGDYASPHPDALQAHIRLAVLDAMKQVVD